MQVFGNIALDEDSQINRYNNFQSFFASLLLLFRCSTGEGWQLVMLNCLGGQKCDDKFLETQEKQITCGQDALAYAFFVSFVFLSTFLVRAYYTRLNTKVRNSTNIPDVKLVYCCYHGQF